MRGRACTSAVPYGYYFFAIFPGFKKNVYKIRYTLFIYISDDALSFFHIILNKFFISHLVPILYNYFCAIMLEFKRHVYQASIFHRFNELFFVVVHEKHKKAAAARSNNFSS